ncbi:MAG: hypothetical protein U0165_11880 [Polyangiaceae bacterium]
MTALHRKGRAVRVRDYEDARSGLWVGVIMGGMATLIFGGLAFSGAIDALIALLAARRLPVTSLILAGVGSLSSLVFAWMAFSSWRMLALWQRINQSSWFATATIGVPQRTNHRINRRNLHAIPLTIAGPNGPYSVSIRWFFPSDLYDKVPPGSRVVVRLDPTNPQQALIDWDKTRESLGLISRSA